MFEFVIEIETEFEYRGKNAVQQLVIVESRFELLWWHNIRIERGNYALECDWYCLSVVHVLIRLHAQC